MTNAQEKLQVKDYQSDVKPIWCPGCGNFGVLSATLKAFAVLGVDPAKVVVASGIGCSGRFPAFVKAYGFHGVHGRSLPLATGIKAANPELTVLAVSGDGDAFSIGAGHLPHAARRNVDITYIVMDNEIYGLTKGQPSPTSPFGMERKASPYGTIDAPVNPIAMMLAYGTSFVARGVSSRPKQLTEIIQRGIQHAGFAFIQVLSSCVSFYNMYDHFKEIITPIPEDHDTTSLGKAIDLALHTDVQYLGVFYEGDWPAHHEQVKHVREISGQDFSLEEAISRFQR